MNRIIGWSLGFFAVVAACFVILFLGGLASAALEIRREKKAGLVPTRPAWENRDKRRAVGGALAQVKLAWASLRTPMRTCWCGRGPLQEFGPDPSFGPGWGCAAWEAGDPVAITRHDAAGGYRRTPSAEAAQQGWGTGVDHIGGAA